jgi:hypothetical protein
MRAHRLAHSGQKKPNTKGKYIRYKMKVKDNERRRAGAKMKNRNKE